MLNEHLKVKIEKVLLLGKRMKLLLHKPATFPIINNLTT